jgi:hypothetical protein
METIQDILLALKENPGAAAVCIGFPVLLAIFLGGDGPGVGGGGCDGDGGD